MKDGFNRNIDYLKISLTSSCNLRCFYCIDEDVSFSKNILSKDDYKFLIKSMSKMGIKKIEFTGGEPLLNDDLCELIYYAKNECYIEEVSITTNGTLFYEKAEELKRAGLDRVNIGINSLKEYRYKSITRGANLNDVLKSFEKASNLGLKVNIEVVIINGFNEDEIYDFIQIMNNFHIDLLFYEVMPVGKCKSIFENGYFDIKEFIKNLEGIQEIGCDDGICKNYYKFEKSRGKMGIVSILDSFSCNNCNEIFITYDARLKLCAYTNDEYDIYQYINKPLTFSEVMKEIIPYKPANFEEIKYNLTTREINEI